MREDPNRPPMNQDQYDVEYGVQPTEKKSALTKFGQKVKAAYCHPLSSGEAFWSAVVGFVPIIDWLPKYSIRNELVGDVVGGLTTGIMHIPQGIAYSALAGVPPVNGLYASCFPALFYMLFGTSRHASIGSFAIIALMAGVASDRVLETHGSGTTVTFLANGTMLTESQVTPMQVAATLTFALGIWQFLCGVFRLQFLMAYFSEPLVSGFTTGAAVHVLLAQIDDLMGVQVPKISGPGFVFRRVYDLAVRVPEANPWALGVSGCSMAFLFIGKLLVSPLLASRCNFRLPVPYELVLVIIATIFSSLLDWNSEHGVLIVGEIPAGLPSLEPPTWGILKECLTQSLGIAVVTIAIHVSMAKVLAKKHNYDIDDHQELYALGMTGILSGFFPVYPISTALGRTMVNVNSGTKTQLSTVFSSGLLLATILWAGPLLNDLPKCVLAAIITVALQSLFNKADELRALYPVSKIDFMIWVVSCAATICIDVMEGLAVAILATIVSVVFRSQWPRWEFSARRRPLDDDVDGGDALDICVFRFDGPLLFINVERFKKSLRTTLDEWNQQIANSSQKNEFLPRFFVVDCSAIAFVDFMGINALKDMTKDVQKRDVTVFLVGANDSLRRKMASSDFFGIIGREKLFPTLRDATAIAKRNASAARMLSTAKRIQIQQRLSGSSPIDSPQSPQFFGGFSPPATSSRTETRNVRFKRISLV